MGILDQLFSNENADTDNEELTADGWVNVAATLAGHQAMIDGYNVKATNIVFSRPELSSVGSTNVSKSINLSKSFRDVILADQLKVPGQRPTADDVVANGIKNGSKVVLYLYNDKVSDVTSWQSMAKTRISGDARFDLIYFDKFSVMSIVEPRNERYQIHQTFAANIIKSFGEQPVIMTISGQIVNGKVNVSYQGDTRSMDWANSFQRLYSKHFSLKACAKNKKRVRIVAQDTVYDGYVLSMVPAVDAENQGMHQVTINFIVAEKRFLNQNDENIPGRILPNGFRLPGRNIPSEFFPRAVLEEYFSQDFREVVSSSFFSTLEEMNKKIRELSVIDGGIAEYINSNLSKYTEGEIQFIRFGSNILLDPYMSGGNIEQTIGSYGIKKALLDSKIRQFNLSNFNSTRTDDIVSRLDTPEYNSLKDEQASLRLIRAGIEAKVKQANIKCSQIRELNKKLTQTDAIL